MIHRLAVRGLLFVLSGCLVLPVCFAEPAVPSAPATKPIPAESTVDILQAPHTLKPGPMDGQIARVMAKVLSRLHYLHARQHFDSTVASKFLDRYLETLDFQHLHFLQTDLAEFETYRTNLDRLTLAENAEPAFVIFNRFVLRLQQHVAYVDELLKNEKFTFDTDERVILNRKGQPYPADLADAKRLWRDRLRFEYLQEKLGKIEARKKPAKTDLPEAQPEPAKTPADPAEKATDTKPKLTDAEEIVETLSHRYHRFLHTNIDWDSDDVLQFYLTALAHVYDPHSDYFGHSQLDSFTISMNLSLFGIGAELVSEDGYCRINRLLPGGPAIKSLQIKEKDRIVAVAQSNQPPVDIVDMSLNKAVQLIRGPKGTEVRLTVIPAGANVSTRKTVSLIRDEIALEDQAAKAKIIELPEPNGQNLRLGVIDLPSFYAAFDPGSMRDKNAPKSSTTEDVSKLLIKLKKEHVAGVILDLRRNGGGSLEEAIRLTGLFIKEGPVVQVRDFDGNLQVEDDRDPSVLYDGPLLVLTSRFSASASEILAGALQDYGRALLVGDASTHGKGTVQSVQPLSDWMYRLTRTTPASNPGALKVTIKKFYRPSGASTQLRGVVPDIVLPSIFNDAKEFGEGSLENPLDGDFIAQAKYERLNMVEPYLSELRKRSGDRVSADKDFSYIREDIELFKKRQADKSVSLNEKQQLKEKDEAELRQKSRDKERRSRPEPKEKVYELTLKLAAQPGLPPPVTKTNALAKLSLGKGQTQAGASTNSALAAAREDHPSAGLDGETDEERPQAVDVALLESEHILVDYLSLLPKSSLVTAGQLP